MFVVVSAFVVDVDMKRSLTMALVHTTAVDKTLGIMSAFKEFRGSQQRFVLYVT